MSNVNGTQKGAALVRIPNGHGEWKGLATFHTNSNEFCKLLSPSDSRYVQAAVTDIAELQRQMVINMLGIGERLSKLRSAIGPEKFYRFMSDVLPHSGISRSTGYRWMAIAEKLPFLFPNPAIRQHLMALTDGKGIVTGVEKDGKRDFSHVVLTPAAEAALKSLPPPPKEKQNSAESEHWVREFIRAMGKARSRERIPGRNLTKDRSVLIQRFNRFVSRYGLAAAEDLCGTMDKILTQVAVGNEHYSS